MTVAKAKAVKCQYCESTKVSKHGKSGSSQHYFCRDCKRSFSVSLPWVDLVKVNHGKNNSKNNSKNNGDGRRIPVVIPIIHEEPVEQVTVINASLAAVPSIKKKALGIGIRTSLKKDEPETGTGQEKVSGTSVLKRIKEQIKVVEDEVKSIPISAGPVEKAIELQFNPTRDAIRGVTIIDRVQGRLLPEMDMINTARRFCIEIATYRQSPQDYALIYGKPFPVQPDLMDELMYRIAQWQKSVGGKSLSNLNSIVQVEKENQVEDEALSSGKRDPYMD